MRVGPYLDEKWIESCRAIWAATPTTRRRGGRLMEAFFFYYTLSNNTPSRSYYNMLFSITYMSSYLYLLCCKTLLESCAILRTGRMRVVVVAFEIWYLLM